MEKWFQKATDFIDNNKNEIIEELKTLVRIPSISQAGKDSLPFGKEVDAALSAAAELYNKNGIPMTVHHNRGYALSVLDGEGDGIGIFGHADVVPVNDDWIKTAPFEPIEENGILYGRGVSDNKAAVIEALYALKALKAAGVNLKSRITIYIGGSEETGMQDIVSFVENERMPAVSITPDSDFPVSVGEKGILHVCCRSKKPLCDILKFEGGKAFNVILDKVEVKAAGGISFTAEGLTSHAAHPEGSVNAAALAAEKLCALSICESDKEILSNLKKAIGNYYGENLNIASEGAFGKLTCANGIVKVEDDKKLMFTLDIRYGNESNPKKLEQNLTSALSSLGFDCEIETNDEGFLLDENGKEMEIILSSCREVANAPDAMPYKTYGGTYARRLKNAFAISHSAPWSEKELALPAGHGGAHQSDEALSVSAYLDGIKTLALILGRLDTHLTQK
ncbi:MAG: M20/M25/M40 family metallo-hydrolase [Oscillospiraceae bacterium]|nr:M20/M25/M40 family metallo-hydrolase [Oscillospiraceae bacterium]